MSAGPCPAWLCVPSLFCAPGMGLAAMPVFILPCRRGQDLPFFYPAHSVSAPQPCVCFAQSAPFRRVHPLLLASNQRLRCFLAAFFCSNPCPFPSGWRMALLRLSSAIKKSPFRALFLCIYQRALPSRTSTCVNVLYFPTPPRLPTSLSHSLYTSDALFPLTLMSAAAAYRCWLCLAPSTFLL